MIKTVLISGGSSGIGLAITKLFLSKGANVIVASRNREKLELNLDNTNKNLTFIKTDFENMDSVKELYQKIRNKFDVIDVAINNVGLGIIKPFSDFTEEEFDSIFNVNLKSLWLSMKLQIPMMLGDKKRQIINISSVNGLGGAEFLSLYSAAKAGVISLTKSVALEQSKSNLSINTIVPGPFDTPMLDSALLTQAGGDKEQKATIEEQYKQFIPQGRFGFPEEIAEMTLWLCEGNSTFLSGHSLIIDGGMSSRYR